MHYGHMAEELYKGVSSIFSTEPHFKFRMGAGGNIDCTTSVTADHGINDSHIL